jgi:hypothetical protein
MQNLEEKEIILEIFLSKVKNNKYKLEKKFCFADKVFEEGEDLKKKSKQLDLDNLSKEYNNIKEELRNLKRKVQILDLQNSDNIEIQKKELVGSIESYFKQKWYAEIQYKFHDRFNL